MKGECKKGYEDCASCDCKVEENNLVEESGGDFDDWASNLEEAEQPTCNIENPEDCENCGS